MKLSSGLTFRFGKDIYGYKTVIWEKAEIKFVLAMHWLWIRTKDGASTCKGMLFLLTKLLTLWWLNSSVKIVLSMIIHNYYSTGLFMWCDVIKLLSFKICLILEWIYWKYLLQLFSIYTGRSKSNKRIKLHFFKYNT